MKIIIVNKLIQLLYQNLKRMGIATTTYSVTIVAVVIVASANVHLENNHCTGIKCMLVISFYVITCNNAALS